MCGFVAFLGHDRHLGEAFVRRGARLLAHRGPDDEGLFVGDGVALGHRRLSIVDLTSAGHQPMASPDGRWVLVYNGEVYNHAELRDRLCRGWQFRSRTDSETVLAALATHGPRALDDMVGMWSFALWDASERRLLVSRDRYGQKPLYWRRAVDGSLRFASEVRPLLEPDERPDAYSPAVAEFLATGNYGHLGDRTFFRDVRSLPPGHWAYASVDDQAPRARRYWRFPTVPARDRRPYDDAARGRFREVFEEAVRSQLMADVPVGVTLSGGLDSSAVVGAIAAARPGQPLHVFTAQSEGSRFDESRYVRAVEEMWGRDLDLHWVRLERVRLSALAPATVAVQEEPFGDPSIAAHGLLMDEARRAGVPVVLGGQGGDELLFGYTHMMHALVASALRAGELRWALGEARALALDARTFARAALSAVAPSVERRMRTESRARRRSWLSGALRDAARLEHADLAPASDGRRVQLEVVERLALPHLTHYDDRSGMARSIEGRMPFLDHRLADVVAALDDRAFLAGGRGKRILRESCADIIPRAVLERTDKIGFFTPLREMLVGEKEWVRGLVADDRARASNLYDVAVVARSLDGLAAGDAASGAAHVVWRALAVRLWAETFGVTFETERGSARDEAALVASV
jgi:asparagine synthase (glutamine-hydrolysing)